VNTNGRDFKISTTGISNLKLQWQTFTHLIVDEVSMMGAASLYLLNTRLQTFKENKLPFGGRREGAVNTLIN